MKNTPTAEEPSEAWASALVAFDRDLRRRGAAEKTRRAYGVDLDQFARWAGGRGLAPEAVSARELRRYAAGLSQRGGAASTVARKLASLRAFYRSLVEHGQVQQNPADLLTAPKRGRRLPRPIREARRQDKVGMHEGVLPQLPATQGNLIAPGDAAQYASLGHDMDRQGSCHHAGRDDQACVWRDVDA